MSEQSFDLNSPDTSLSGYDQVAASSSRNGRAGEGSRQQQQTNNSRQEEDEHGLPALSNPLKLLASASMSHHMHDQPVQSQASREQYTAQPPPPAPAPAVPMPYVSDEVDEPDTILPSPSREAPPPTFATSSNNSNSHSNGHRQDGQKEKDGNRNAPLNGQPQASLSHGLYSERLDLEPSFDPVRIIGETHARSAFTLFLDHINGPLTCE